MLVIRLIRTGKKNQPFFRVIVCDKKNPPRAGRFLEILGSINPLTKKKELKIERIKHWLSVGAKPSETVFNLLIKEGIVKGKKIPMHKKSKKVAEKVAVSFVEAPVKPDMLSASETPASETVPPEPGTVDKV